MKVHELGIPRLESTMQRLLQRPDAMEVEDVRDLVDAALGCLKRRDLLMSNLLLVEIARGLQNPTDAADWTQHTGYGEILEEVFGS